MGFRRTPVKHFELANPGYAGATVSFYAIDLDTYERTSELITLYDSFSGTSTISNPYTMDSEGKFPSAVYFEEPYIAVVNGSNVEDHELGVTIPQAGGFQGVWVESETYAKGDLVLDDVAGADTGNMYVCTSLHVSSDWATDLIDGKWSLVLDAATLLQSVSLALLSALTPAENKVPYFSSDSEADLLTVTTVTKALLALSSEANIRSFLSLVIGTNVQAYSANLDDFAALTAPTGDVVGNSDAQTLTNKIINAASNTISNLATSMFAANVIDTDSTFAANSNTRIPTQAAVKTLVENAELGVNYFWGEAWASTTAALPACTYNNGTGGVGATLTGNANGVIPDATMDDITLDVGWEVVVKDQSDAKQNGVYVVTQVGDGSNPFILTRSSAADSSSEIGYLTINVAFGAANQGVWRVNQSGATIGTTPITFTRISSPGIVTADEVTLTKIGNQFSVLATALLAIAGLTPAANKLAYFTSGSAAALADLTAAGRALIDDADASAQRTTLSAAARTQTGLMMLIPIPSLTSDLLQTIIKDNKLGTITITSMTTYCNSGTATVTGKIGGVNLGGTANSMSNTENIQSHASANTIANGADFALDFSSVSNVVGGVVVVEYSVTFA